MRDRPRVLRRVELHGVEPGLRLLLVHPPAGLNGELLMTIGRKIAFLGAGNMAGALIDGLLRAGACAPSEVMAMDVDLALLVPV